MGKVGQVLGHVGGGWVAGWLSESGLASDKSSGSCVTATSPTQCKVPLGCV